VYGGTIPKVFAGLFPRHEIAPFLLCCSLLEI